VDGTEHSEHEASQMDRQGEDLVRRLRHWRIEERLQDADAYHLEPHQHEDEDRLQDGSGVALYAALSRRRRHFGNSCESWSIVELALSTLKRRAIKLRDLRSETDLDIRSDQMRGGRQASGSVAEEISYLSSAAERERSEDRSEEAAGEGRGGESERGQRRRGRRKGGREGGREVDGRTDGRGG